MIRLLRPRDAGFFGFFQKLTELTCAAGLEFQALLEKPEDERALIGERIKSLEHQADSVTHDTMTTLHKTFITPLDREDIHVLIKRLDDVMDFIDASAQRIVLYKIGVVPPELKRLAEINTQSAELLRKAVSRLNDLKNPKDLLQYCVDINRLENEADQVLRRAVAGLFADEPDLRRLIKLKEIFELMETVTDRCEDVANVIESIVIEYS